MIRMICLIIGYMFGLIQTSYLYGRMKGLDIRQHGSGNAGSTNALRVLGKKAGAISLAGDCFKCVAAVVVVRLLFKSSYGEIMPLLSIYAAAGCILGHNFPFYLRFHGGKGIAASVGMIAAIDWKIFIIAAVVFFSAYFITHYVSVGSLAGYLSAWIAFLVFGQMGFYQVEQPVLIEMYVIMTVLTALAWYRHRENIKRLIQGTENKLYLKSTK